MESSNANSSRKNKKALIIGIDDYSRLNNNKLNNSIDNANKLSDVLNNIEFDVTLCLQNDHGDKITEAVTEFAKDIRKDDLILFYFSGHGRQVNHINYLIPKDDSHIDDDESVKDLASNVQGIVDLLTDKNTKPHTTIVILDCCRPYLLQDVPTPTDK